MKSLFTVIYTKVRYISTKFQVKNWKTNLNFLIFSKEYASLWWVFNSLNSLFNNPGVLLVVSSCAHQKPHVDLLIRQRASRVKNWITKHNNDARFNKLVTHYFAHNCAMQCRLSQLVNLLINFSHHIIATIGPYEVNNMPILCFILWKTPSASIFIKL